MEDITNVLSIDVEEHFHAQEVQPFVDTRRWSLLPSRVEAQTHFVLDLIATHNVSATFFVLGWVAERYPALVRRIVKEGHQVGCHSYAHRLVYELTPTEFRRDTHKAVEAIQNACGKTPLVYRAPSYSITSKSLWALDILAEYGFTHDSSIYPISHDRYGIPGSERHPYVITTASGPIREIPIATVRLSSNRVAPVGGGAYLRLLPYRYTAAGIRRINGREHESACIYFHPWELDIRQPRMAAGWISRLRTYAGLTRMVAKVSRLLEDFRFSTIAEVHAGMLHGGAKAGCSMQAPQQEPNLETLAAAS